MSSGHDHNVNDEPCCSPACVSKCVTTIGVVGALMIVAVLVWAMRHYTRPEPIGANRAAERAKHLADLRDESAKQFNNYDWQDQQRGVVRLKIDRAVELTLQGMQKDMAAFRLDLSNRVEKATAALPKPPEKKSDFE